MLTLLVVSMVHRLLSYPESHPGHIRGLFHLKDRKREFHRELVCVFNLYVRNCICMHPRNQCPAVEIPKRLFTQEEDFGFLSTLRGGCNSCWKHQLGSGFILPPHLEYVIVIVMFLALLHNKVIFSKDDGCSVPKSFQSVVVFPTAE